MRHEAFHRGFCASPGGILKDFLEDGETAQAGAALLEPAESIPLGVHRPTGRGARASAGTGAVEIGDMS